MKSKLNRYWGLLATAAVALSGAFPASMMAQTPPVGIWDCVVSGTSQGISYLEFSGNTLSGYTLLTQIPKRASSSVDLRNGGAVPGRNGPTFSTNDVTASTNWFGIMSVEGQWIDLGSGKLLGYLTESGYALTAQTNQVFETNETVVTTNVGVSYSTNWITNAFSFTGKASAKKLVIKSSGSQGNRVFSGKPATEVADLSGSYYAIGKSNDVDFVEFLTVTPNSGWFDVSGTGAGYSFTGTLVESAQKRVGLVTYEGDSSIPRFSVTGPVNTKKGTADMKGTDGAGSLIRYKIIKQPSI